MAQPNIIEDVYKISKDIEKALNYVKDEYLNNLNSEEYFSAYRHLLDSFKSINAAANSLTNSKTNFECFINESSLISSNKQEKELFPKVDNNPPQCDSNKCLVDESSLISSSKQENNLSSKVDNSIFLSDSIKWLMDASSLKSHFKQKEKATWMLENNVVYYASSKYHDNLSIIYNNNFSNIDSSLLNLIREWKPRYAQSLLLNFLFKDGCYLNSEMKESVGFTTVSLFGLITKISYASKRNESRLGIAVVNKNKFNIIKNMLCSVKLPFFINFVEDKESKININLENQLIICRGKIFSHIINKLHPKKVDHLFLYYLPKNIGSTLRSETLEKVRDVVTRNGMSILKQYFNIENHVLVNVSSFTRSWILLEEDNLNIITEKRIFTAKFCPNESRIFLCGVNKSEIEKYNSSGFEYIENIKDIPPSFHSVVLFDPPLTVGSKDEIRKLLDQIYARNIIIILKRNNPFKTIFQDVIQVWK